MPKKIQLGLDWEQPKSVIPKTKPHSVHCLECGLLIDLHLQAVREIKACPHCGDRTWLLNLKTKEACILYSINPDSLGGRLRDDD